MHCSLFLLVPVHAILYTTSRVLQLIPFPSARTWHVDNVQLLTLNGSDFTNDFLTVAPVFSITLIFSPACLNSRLHASASFPFGVASTKNTASDPSF